MAMISRLRMTGDFVVRAAKDFGHAYSTGPGLPGAAANTQVVGLWPLTHLLAKHPAHPAQPVAAEHDVEDSVEAARLQRTTCSAGKGIAKSFALEISLHRPGEEPSSHL